MQGKDSIAIFGGSFNPPLNSHLKLAEQILNCNLKITKVIFVPVSTKYNKKGLANDSDRYNMLNLMCKYKLNLEVSDLELKTERQLYTIETLELFQQMYPEKNIYFIIGTDNLKELKNWKSPEQILNKFKIIVMGRNKDNINEIIEKDELLKRYRNSLINLDNDMIMLSSTFVREQIKNKKDISKFMPKEIIDYINKNNLYK